MNGAKHESHEKNIIKVIMLSVVIFLFAFLTITISALLLGLLSGISMTIVLAAALIFVVLGFTTLLTILIRFFHSIDKVNSKVQILAQGELKMDDLLKRDSFGLETLTEAFNDMKANLSSFISLTKVNIITISDALDNLSKSMDRSYLSNKQIVSSMEKVAEKTQDQARLMGDAMASIDEVKNRIEIITENIEKFEKSVGESVHATASGVNNLEEYYKQVNIISDNLNSTSEYIKKLNADITQIESIGKIISKTSEQLKLLGLNASVEAAKAGESGKGFSVVAHEMNLLSATTKQSVGKINDILKNIQDRSEFVSKSIDDCVENYDISKNIFKSIKQSFEIIYDNANVLESDIKKVHKEVDLINANVHEINEKSQQLHEISEDISNSTNDVSAVTQEELGELQKINISTSALGHMLIGFEELIERFNTSIVPVKTDSKAHLRIAFICPLDNDYWYVVRKGIMYAKKELAKRNATLEFYGMEQDVETGIRETLKKVIDDNVNGIIVTGFDPKLAELIEEAYNKNIPVMTFNVDLPVKSKRVAHFGANFNYTGILTARSLVKAVKGKGEVTVFTGNGNEFWKNEILAELKKFKKVKVTIRESCAATVEQTYNAAKELLTQNKNIRAIAVLGFGMIGAVRAIEELELVGKTYVVSCFYSKEIARFIKQGTVFAAISHDPFGQGHDAVIHMYNMLVTGQKPESENIWSPIEVIDKKKTYELL